MPRVQNLFRARKKHLPMEELFEVHAVGDTGFEGCAHARLGSKRQVLLVVPDFAKSFGDGAACCAAF
jgi:7-keto-8-aminopelargonate synthetase-like enzyme